MHLLDNETVRRLLSRDEAMAAVQGAFRRAAAGEAAIQARQRISAAGVKLSTMAAVDPGDGIAGAKVYTTIAGRFSFVVLLFSTATGAPLAVLESDAMTEIRTGAVSAVAARALARPDSATLAVFGTGIQARSHVAALAAVLPLRRVDVVSRGDCGAFCAEVEREVGIAAAPAAGAAEALADADLVVTATRAATPLFEGGMLPPGAFVAAVGSTLPGNAELSPEAVARCRVVVEWLPQARAEAGDLIAAAAARVLEWSGIEELGPILAGTAPGRSSPEEIILFESVGIGLEDVAVGAAVYRRAVAEGLIGG